jgi:hypothetical protein
MTDPILLRRRVRMILSALPANRYASERLIFDNAKPDFADLRLDELQTALTWNHERGYAEYRYNEDEERNEWRLTSEGRVKEGLARA